MDTSREGGGSAELGHCTVWTHRAWGAGRRGGKPLSAGLTRPSSAAALPPGGRAAQGFPGTLPRAARLLTLLSPQPGDVSPGKG